MKSIEKANTKQEERKKMTLRDYFNSLPDAAQIAPRKNLITRISERCGVPYSTARSWLAYEVKPRNEEHLRVISEETGIAVEDFYDVQHFISSDFQG
ncbi:MAG: hypothetical protein HDS71_06180 [Bacteroidales bacterium]|nr:hypothetical protein [Bacteroidales bacterium]